jgi:membrane protease YdiL (CAAX protease family)
MLAEELIKFIPLMFFMRLFYRVTANRKLSIIVSTVIILIFFGLLHYEPGLTPIASVLLIQGAGSIFELYGYIKTKNLLVPYISHLLTDAFIFILVMLGL